MQCTVSKDCAPSGEKPAENHAWRHSRVSNTHWRKHNSEYGHPNIRFPAAASLIAERRTTLSFMCTSRVEMSQLIQANVPQLLGTAEFGTVPIIFSVYSATHAQCARWWRFSGPCGNYCVCVRNALRKRTVYKTREEKLASSRIESEKAPSAKFGLHCSLALYKRASAW